MFFIKAQETGSVTRTKVSVNFPALERVTTFDEGLMRAKAQALEKLYDWMSRKGC